MLRCWENPEIFFLLLCVCAALYTYGFDTEDGEETEPEQEELEVPPFTDLLYRRSPQLLQYIVPHSTYEDFETSSVAQTQGQKQRGELTIISKISETHTHKHNFIPLLFYTYC